MIENWRLSGDHRGRPKEPSIRRCEPSAPMSHTPAWALGMEPGLSRKTIRSSAGEKSGQFPGPRSLTNRRSPSSSIDFKCERLKSALPTAMPGVASKTMRRPSCDHDGDPHWLTRGSGSLAMSVAAPPSAAIRYRPTWPAVADGRAGCRRSCSTSRATAWAATSSPAFRPAAALCPWARTNPQAGSPIDKPSSAPMIVRRTMRELLGGVCFRPTSR